MRVDTLEHSSMINLSHCAISPLFGPAVDAEHEIAQLQRDQGVLMGVHYPRILNELHKAAADLLCTSPENISFCKNTTEGISLVANGYPFASGDRIISYVHEYPANHYPWRLQEAKGVQLDLLPDRSKGYATALPGPCAWDMNDLEAMVTKSTKVVALSHVQFVSGFAADIKELGEFCKDRNIDLIIDAAQSLGCMPLYPEEWHVSAVASAGWKWLMGPIGTGLLYTSEAFREKIAPVIVGAETMQQGLDYLDHSWQPHQTAKRFEYSTSPISLAAALVTCIKEFHLQHGVENIWQQVSRHIDSLCSGLDRSLYSPIVFDQEHRSGILALHCKKDTDLIVNELAGKGIIATARAGYLRLAPHCYLSDGQVSEAINICNGLSG